MISVIWYLLVPCQGCSQSFTIYFLKINNFSTLLKKNDFGTVAMEEFCFLYLQAATARLPYLLRCLRWTLSTVIYKLHSTISTRVVSPWYASRNAPSYGGWTKTGGRSLGQSQVSCLIIKSDKVRCIGISRL